MFKQCTTYSIPFKTFHPVDGMNEVQDECVRGEGWGQGRGLKKKKPILNKRTKTVFFFLLKTWILHDSEQTVKAAALKMDKDSIKPTMCVDACICDCISPCTHSDTKCNNYSDA